MVDPQLSFVELNVVQDYPSDGPRRLLREHAHLDRLVTPGEASGIHCVHVIFLESDYGQHTSILLEACPVCQCILISLNWRPQRVLD